MSRKHTPQIFDVFWETFEEFLDLKGHLIASPLTSSSISTRMEEMESKVYAKVGALRNCVGFIDATVIEISRPDDTGLQNVCYNVHKRKNELKYKAVETAEGMLYLVYGPVEGRRNYWTL